MRTNRFLKLAVALFAVAAGVTVAGASTHHRNHHDEHERGEDHDDRRGRGPERAAAIDPVYAKECGACHLPYPPTLLPASSWRALLSNLGDHFKQDAELAPDVRTRLESWLVASSGADQRTAALAPLRITETDWFRRKHRKVPGGAAARPSIRTMANCAACHPRAAAWEFDEDVVRIPRG